jgi:prepilin-type N-terminal cleavage/methylation domain-containing protein
MFHKQSSLSRTGFTLIELLVAISIFLILLTITAQAVRRTTMPDRMAAATRQIQATIEGARSRAFQKRAPFGVRFILDAENNAVCTSMIYISPPTMEKGKLRLIPDYDPKADSTSSEYNPDRSPIFTNISTDPTHAIFATRVYYDKYDATDGISWDQLDGQRLIFPGTKISIPATDGITYVVSGQDYKNSVTNDPPYFRIFPEYIESTVPSNTLDYAIELAPTPAGGESPIVFPQNVAIDFSASGSLVPNTWKSSEWTENTIYAKGTWVQPSQKPNPKNLFFRVLTGGLSATIPDDEPTWSNYSAFDTFTDNGVTFEVWDVRYLDMIFSSTGSIIDEVGAAGIVRFLLVEKKDLDLNIKGSDNTENSADFSAPARGERLIVSIFTQTGSIQISPVDPTDKYNDVNPNKFPGAVATSGAPDYIADDLFRFAKRGQEAK